MKKSNLLAYYLEDLWSRGFKLTDEEVRFIYFGKSSTNATDWLAIMALQVTLRIQYRFDGSFFLSLLELFTKESVKNQKEIAELLIERGFVPKEEGVS